MRPYAVFFAVAVTVLASACVPATPVLHPLDAAHADVFRHAFDAARGHTRFVVALSPT